jgi:pimeloyl-ACP methyl ester carboxylesterase
MPTVHVNECGLNYEEAGEGPPLLFIHGLWGSGRFFHRQLPYFSERYRTILLDLRGHGGSEHTAGGHVVAQHARDVRGVLKELDLDDVVVAGWSMGTLVMLDYVEQFGTDKLRALIDIDQSPTDFKAPDWPHGLFDLPTLREVHTGVQTDHAATVEHMVPLMFKEPPSDDDRAWIVEELLRLPPGIAGSILFDQTLADYRETLSKMSIPTLLCYGRGDTVPVAAGEYMRDRMPNARLVVFEESNHCPFLEEPDRFNQVVDDWIETLP